MLVKGGAAKALRANRQTVMRDNSGSIQGDVRGLAARGSYLEDDKSDVDSTYRGFMDDDVESQQNDNRRLTCFVNNEALNGYNDGDSEGGYVRRKDSNGYSDEDDGPKKGYLNNKQRRDTTYDY